MKTLAQLKIEAPTARLYETKEATGLTGEPFVFRRPTPKEWRIYKAAALSARVVDGQAQIDGLGMMNAFVDLSERCTLSHTPAELSATEEENLNLYAELGAEIAATIEKELEARGKASAPAGTPNPAT